MKSLIWLCLAIMILLVACGTRSQGGNLPYPFPQPPGQVETQAYPAPQAVSPTGAEGYPAPARTPTPITWEEAKAAILEGNVAEAIQLHSLTVYLVLADGTRLITEEPEIDAILAMIEECGAPCENIEIITE